ncbi:MAG: EamA family transporter [Bacteroides cellulosilyticus]
MLARATYVNSRNNTRAIIYACIAVLSWSTVATAFKIALTHLTHFEMLLIASCTSLLIFALLLTFQKKWKLLSALPARQWGYFALLGLLNPVAYYLVLFKAYDLLPAQVAQPIKLCMAYCAINNLLVPICPSAHTSEEIYRYVYFSGWSSTYFCRNWAVGWHGYTCSWVVVGSIECLVVGYVLDDK